jgi:hypothetical protein
MAIPIKVAETLNELPEVEHVSRDVFVTEVFDYEPGEHVTIVGPTGTGKTTLAYDLIDQYATSKVPAVILVKKPRDGIVKKFSKTTGFKVTQTWPPIWSRGWNKKQGGLGKKRRGFVYWPKRDLSNLRKDNKRIATNFEKVITECYRKGSRILFVDDLVGVSKELGLEPVLTTVYMEGRSMECGLWGAIQRPYHAPVIMYGAAEHVILFKDPDKRSIDRYKEIGGIDPLLVETLVNNLKKHQFLYIGRNRGEDGVSPGIAVVEGKIS